MARAATRLPGRTRATRNNIRPRTPGAAMGSLTHPFGGIAARIAARPALRRAISAARRRPEPECIAALLREAELAASQQPAVTALAKRLVEGLRAREGGISP